jgi:hypothetical protein
MIYTTQHTHTHTHIKDNSDLMPPKLLDWFEAYGITDRRVLTNLAPLFRQVGATEPLEIAHVVMEKEVNIYPR